MAEKWKRRPRSGWVWKLPQTYLNSVRQNKEYFAKIVYDRRKEDRDYNITPSPNLGELIIMHAWYESNQKQFVEVNDDELPDNFTCSVSKLFKRSWEYELGIIERTSATIKISDINLDEMLSKGFVHVYLSQKQAADVPMDVVKLIAKYVRTNQYWKIDIDIEWPSIFEILNTN